jgi:hypothetical protein
LNGRLFKGKVGPIGRNGDRIVSGEEAGIDVDLSEVEEFEGHFGQLVLLGGRAGDIGINQTLELHKTSESAIAQTN